MADDIPSKSAEEVDEDEDEAPVKKGKKSRKSKGKKHAHNHTDNAEECNVPNPDTEASTSNQPTSEAPEQAQNGVSADANDRTMRHNTADPEAATAPAGGGPLNAERNRSSSFSSTEGTTSGNTSGHRGVEKLLRGIFVEPIVAVGAAAKDAGETAMRPVKQVNCRNRYGDHLRPPITRRACAPE